MAPSNNTETNKRFYRTLTDVLSKKNNDTKTSPDRYQTIVSRLERANEQVEDTTNYQIHTGKYKTMWKGIQTLKDCREMIIYQAIISDVKPLTIFDLGTYTGGNAVWLADSLKSLDVPGRVITVDKESDGVDPLVHKYPGVTFIAGDINEIHKLLPEDMLQNLPHPWLVIEDCHVNTGGSMRYFEKHMEVGDYFAIEDTSMIMGEAAWGSFNDDVNKALGVGYWGDGGDSEKHGAIVDFLKEHSQTFMVDSWYTDYFGFNGTNTWDGYIKKVK